MRRFRIYYGDGTTYTGDPFDAPRVNVQVIAIEHPTPTGFGLIHTKDHYVYDAVEDWWLGVDWAGLWDYLMMRTGPKTVLFGRTIRDEPWNEIIGRAAREGLG